MNENTRSTLIQSQIACAMIEAMGMTAENKQREILGNSMAYDDKAFFDLIEKYGIGYNTVIDYLREY